MANRPTETPAPRGARDLHPARVLELCRTSRLARTVVLFDSADSTNAVAMEAASRGAPEGLLVIAEEQRRGKGRKSRTWSSVKGKSLTFSLLLRPACRVEGLTAIFALAAVKALGRVAKDVGIKWPNDVLIGGRKAAGILAEAKGDAVVIGMGLNVNERPEELPAGVSPPAVSLAMTLGRNLDRGRLLARIVGTFEKLYVRFEREGFASFRREIEDRLLYVGSAVTVETGEAKLEGGLLGITDDGYLRLAVAGEERIVSAGDLTLREGSHG
jgi:BirA family biotin operon repressor/biotin-[acetyl-CoA-carboxylase] ligase